MSRPGAMATLARLRHLAVDDAKRALAEALKAETEAAWVARAARAAIGLETEAACALGAEDACSEAFARWLPYGRAALAAAKTALSQAEAASLAMRAQLTSARAAAEIVDKQLAMHAAAMQAEAERRAQITLDEIGQRNPRS